MVKYTKATSKGFTLIEILIVIMTVAVFGTITTEMLANASKIYSSSIKRQNLINEARSTFFKIIREASWQKSFSSFAGSNNKKLVAVPVKNGLKPNGFKPKKDNLAILIL